MSSNAADRQHTVEQYERTLRRISQAINAINIIRYENMDKPELEGIANPALNQLTQLEREVVNALTRHQESLNTSSSLKRLARQVLTQLSSFKKRSGLSPASASRQEQDIISRFNLQSEEVMRVYRSHEQQSSVPILNRAPSSSATMTHNAQPNAYLGSRGNHNDQPSSANRIYEGSSGLTTSRNSRGYVYRSSAQQNYHNSQMRVQDFYQGQSITHDPPPPYYSMSGSQRDQSGSVNSSRRDQNSGYGSVHSDEATRGSHRSIRSGVTYDSRNAEASTSRGARVSSVGSGFSVSDEGYSNEATHGSMDEYQGPSRQVRRGEYPPGTAASGSSSQSNYYYSSGYPVRDESY